MSLQNSRQISDVKVLLKMGSDGAGIIDIELTSSQGNVDTYTITLSNGNKYTFNVTNGAGIESIEKTGTQGLVDTYTIYVDDGTSYTFTVTNGKDGQDGGSSIMFLITSDAGSTVTVTDPDGTVTPATQVQGSTTEWECEATAFGNYTITSVLGGSTQTQTVTADICKLYLVHVEHFAATITVTYPTGATCTCVGSSESYTATTNPYTFMVHNADTYTITATDGTTTKSENVVISTDGQSESVTIEFTKTITVDFYSAASDTVTYVGIDAIQHTIITDSNGHVSADIVIDPNGSTLTFTSSVAKDPNNLSNDYSKAIALTDETTEIYLMPDSTLYWYGYNLSEILSTANGWSWNYTLMNPTFNTNNVYLPSDNIAKASGIGSPSVQPTKTRHVLVKNTVSDGSCYFGKNINKSNSGSSFAYTRVNTSANIQHITLSDTSSSYFYIYSDNKNKATVYALWSE